MRHRDLSRAQNKSNHDKTNKSLQNAYSQIGALCESRQIAKPIAETAKLLFKMTEDGKVFKGKAQNAVIAGCIFIACRQHDMGRSFREIYNLTKVNKKDIGRTFKVSPDAFFGRPIQR
jgi:transcription initiation factor TFIIB